MNRIWLAREILNNQAPMTTAMAKFFQKLDLAIKVSLSPDTVKQAISFNFREYNMAEIASWNPLLATLVWVEGCIPSNHMSIFGDHNILKILSAEETPFDVPFGMLIEMSADTTNYKLTWLNKPMGIAVNPLQGNLFFKENTDNSLSWGMSKSPYFEKDYWELDIAKEILPNAETSMLGAASFFFGIMALLGGQELTNWQQFSIVRN